MGYQNNERPEDKKTLRFDILADMDDLKYDVKDNLDVIGKDKMFEYIEFVKQSMIIYMAKDKKKKKKSKKKAGK